MAQLFGSCPQPTLLRNHSGWLAMQSLLRLGRRLPAFVDEFNKAIVLLLYFDLEAAPGVWDNETGWERCKAVMIAWEMRVQECWPDLPQTPVSPQRVPLKEWWPTMVRRDGWVPASFQQRQRESALTLHPEQRPSRLRRQMLRARCLSMKTQRKHPTSHFDLLGHECLLLIRRKDQWLGAATGRRALPCRHSLSPNRR
jgi:hypothetical protein